MKKGCTKAFFMYLLSSQLTMASDSRAASFSICSELFNQIEDRKAFPRLQTEKKTGRKGTAVF